MLFFQFRKLSFGRLAFSLLLFISVQLFAAPAETHKPLLLASIKPLQLLALAIAGDHMDVELLLPATVSPHLYQLKPSARRRLAEAHQVLWLGPELERFLVKPLSLLATDRVLTLLDSNSSEVAGHHDNEDSHAASAQQHSTHEHHNIDPHIWLSPVKAIAMANKIYRRLALLAPENESFFRLNLQHFQQQLTALDTECQQQFSQIQARPYMVLHDAYQHFEHHYGVSRVAALTVSPDRKPGAKHIWEITKQIEAEQINCLFREPQYQPAILTNITAGTAIKTQLLDPMAIAIPLSQDAFIKFYQQFSHDFMTCIR